jgi:hypothetical protein
MKSRTKKASILALFISVLMLAALIPVSAVADDATFTAQFAAQFDDTVTDVNGWELGDIAATTFAVGETATISITFDELVKFDANYAAIETDVPYPAFTAEITSFKLDGVEIPMGAAFINDEGIVKNETLRLTICNKWNSDIPVQPLEVGELDEFTSIEISFVVTEADEAAITAIADADGAEDAAPAAGGGFDPNGTYMAFLQVQTQNWNFRDNWCSSFFGESGSDWASNGGTHDGSFDVVYHTDNGVQPGTFNNAVIAGNGTYRVSIEDFNFAATCETFNILAVSTNIPNEGNPLEFSDVKVLMNGRDVARFDGSDGNRWVIQGIDTRDNADYYQVIVINQWNNDLPDFGYIMPEDGEIAIEFTVTGFAYDKAEDGNDEANEADEGNDTASGGEGTAAGGSDDSDDDGSFPVVLVIVIAAAVVAVVVAIVVVKKKK